MTTFADTVRPGTWACPDARQILPAGASREVWLYERRKGIGGSDASTVAGLNPYSGRYELWLDKTGRGKPQEETNAMRFGRLLEPVIQQWFTEETGIAVRRTGLMRSRRHPWQQVSLDGMTADGGIAEWKTTSWRTEDAEVWLDGAVPDHAELQAQHGLAVTGRTHAHCCVLIDGREPLHKVVERDDELIATLTDMEHRFWYEHVVDDEPPALDGSESTAKALKHQYRSANHGLVSAGREVDELIAERKRAKEAAAFEAKRATEVDNRLRALLGEATGLAVHGLVKATLHQNGTFSPDRFAQEHPDLFAEYQTTAEVFDLARLKTERPDLYEQYRARVLRIPAKPKPAKDF